MFNVMVDEEIRSAATRQTQGVPAGLDEMEPGPFLAIVLSGINLDRLCGNDRIVVLRARQRMASHYAAETFEAMTSIVDATRMKSPGATRMPPKPPPTNSVQRCS